MMEGRLINKVMPNEFRNQPSPVPVSQVMVSSTYTDLKNHRAALIKAITAHGLYPNAMEHGAAGLTDVIASSFEMVRDSAAYILLISQKYGQTPECQLRNPKVLSITELEFDEALRLKRPTLLFIMGEKHKKCHPENDPEKKAKLDVFRERAKKVSPDSSVHRVYAIFNSLQEFKDKVSVSLAELKRHLTNNSASSRFRLKRYKEMLKIYLDSLTQNELEQLCNLLIANDNQYAGSASSIVSQDFDAGVTAPSGLLRHAHTYVLPKKCSVYNAKWFIGCVKKIAA